MIIIEIYFLELLVIISEFSLVYVSDCEGLLSVSSC